MQVIFRETEANSIVELTPVQQPEVRDEQQKISEPTSHQKSSFRKFTAECNLQAQCAAQESLTDQFKAGILQHRVEKKIIDPNTLIHRAILENNPEVIRFLLEQGVDVDYPDENGMSPLTIAILNRCNYAIEVLLQNGADVNPAIKWNDMTLLQLSLYMQDIKSASALVDCGTDIKNGDVLFDLMWRSGAIDQTEYKNLLENMLKRGALISDRSVLKALTNYCYSKSELILFFSYGLDVNRIIKVTEPFGNRNEPLTSILIYAISNENPQNKNQLTQFLIEKGANVNQEVKLNSNVITPLIRAIEKGNLELIEMFVEKGADVNKGYYEMKTPLKLALNRNRPDIVQYLLQHGAKA